MIGFICALDVEVSGIKDMMDNPKQKTIAKITYTSGKIFGKEVVCCECGVGKVNAAMSTQIMIDAFSPDCIINSGIAGSLSKEIAIGDIVISKDCVQHDYDGTEMGDPLGEIWFCDEKRIDLPANEDLIKKLHLACKALQDTNITIGRIATGDTFVASHDRRTKIADTFSAIACEMEGGAVAQVCYRNSIPFAVLRCISDDFNENEFMDYIKFRDIAAKKSISIVENFIKNY